MHRLKIVCFLVLACLAFIIMPVAAERVLLGYEQFDEVASALSAVNGQQLKHFSRIRVVLAELPEGKITDLKQNKGIRYAESDAYTRASQTIMPWNITHINAPLVWQQTNGRQVRVAVLDTGIDAAHRDLMVDLTKSYTATGITGSALSDVNGHGTHVAGIIAALDNETGVWGVAPAARLYSVKVLDDTGAGTVSDLIDGIQWAIQNGMQIVNISLGTKKESQALREAVEDAYDAGLLLIAAAGNGGNKPGQSDNIEYPAAYASVMAVGAVDRYDIRASFSATGAALDIVAPGVDIVSTWTGGNAYRSISGTSAAAPHVSGVAALIWAYNSTWNNRQVREQILATTRPVGDGDPFRYGRGRVDAAAAIGSPNQQPIPMGNITANAQVQRLEKDMQIIISAWADGVVLSGAVVTLTVRTPVGSNYSVNGYTDETGVARFSMRIRPKDGTGTFTIRAQVDKAGCVGAVTTTEFVWY